MSKSLHLLRNVLSSSAFWMVNKALARQIGHAETILLCELIYQEEMAEERNELGIDGFFACTLEELEKKTAITFKTQKRYCKKLEDAQFIQTTFRDIPRKKYYKLNHDFIETCIKTFNPQGLNNNRQNNQTRTEEKSKQVKSKELSSIRQNVSANNNKKNNKKKINNNINTFSQRDFQRAYQWVMDLTGQDTERENQIMRALRKADPSVRGVMDLSSMEAKQALIACWKQSQEYV